MTTFANGESGLSVRTKINNVLQHADGTAGELVINEAGADVDFRVESDTSTHALFVDGATGNVGIGVVPSAWNAFWKNIQVTSASFGGSGAVVNYATMASNIFSDGASYLPNAKYIASGTATAYIQNAGQHQWFTAPSGTAGNAITFTQAMALGTNGNLAIGTTLASSRLTITGAGNSLGGTTEFNAEIVQENSTAKRGLFFGHDTSSQIGIVGANSGGVPSNLAFWTFNGAAWGERLRIDASGNVGIGTSSPAAGLHIVQTDPAIRLTRTTDFFYGQLSADGFSAYTNTNDNAPIIFKTAINERMRIDASGNVGIGTSSPGVALDVVRSGDNGIQFRNATRTVGIGTIGGVASVYAGSGTELMFHIGGERMRIDASGNLLIGTSASGASKLRISGLPTSAAGLSAGDVWNDAGTLKIA